MSASEPAQGSCVFNGLCNAESGPLPTATIAYPVEGRCAIVDMTLEGAPVGDERQLRADVEELLDRSDHLKAESERLMEMARALKARIDERDGRSSRKRPR